MDWSNVQFKNKNNNKNSRLLVKVETIYMIYDIQSGGLFSPGENVSRMEDVNSGVPLNRNDDCVLLDAYSKL